MVLDDAEVNLAVADHGEEGLGRHLGDFAVVPKAEVLQIELLLVDCRRSQYGRIDALASDLLTVGQFIGPGNLPVAEPRPAGIQSQGLGQQDELLAVVSDFLIQILSFLSCHDEVILHSGEGSVGHRAAEGLGLAGHKLDVQSGLPVNLPDLIP